MPRAATRAVKDPSRGPLVFDRHALHVNDHVYVSAPWDDREGEPYIVARVLEILQPQPPKPSAASSDPANADKATTESASPAPVSNTGSGASTDLRVRVAYYFRTRDITNRYVADHRLVVATMFADTVPASYIRGFCTVKHREHIEELEVYKRQDDSFYWHQLYDRYLHRYFDAVPTYKVQNAPPEVVRHLNDNFEFVLCEVGSAAELCDAQRGCCVCRKWAAKPESVACARCSRVFHLTCVDPPLAAKPKAGYGWSCAPCSKAHDEEVEGYLEAGFGPPPVRKAAVGVEGPPGKALAAAGSQMLHANKKGKARQVDANSRPDPHDWRMTNGWPFRYFGMHSNAYNVLDPHDSLYPRASTRLGNKFQCVVPAWDPVAGCQEATPEARAYFQPKRSRASTPMGKAERAEKEKARRAKSAEAPPRGEDSAVTIIWRPTDKISDATLDDLFTRTRKISTYATAGVDLLNRAIVILQNKDGNVHDTIASLRKIALQSLGHASWADDEKRKLAEGAAQYHNDIEEIKKLLPNKKMGDVVKRYYINVGHTLQEDEPQQPEEKAAVVATRSGRRTGRKVDRVAGGGDDDARATASDDDDHGSVCGAARTPAQRRNRFCAVCETTESDKWWYCPENICELEVKPSPMVMCDSCGIRWRHYGAQYPPYGDEIKPLPAERKKKDKALEEERRLAEEEVAVVVKPKEPTPPPPKPVIPPKPCLLCKRFEPKTALFQCDNCTISYHASCYGIDMDWEWPHDEWLCNLCERDKNHKKLNLHPHCILCPEPPKEFDVKAPLTALDCLKPTELQNYVHHLCAIWHRELQLGHPPTVQPVESFAHLPIDRRLNECSICHLKGVGATIKCEDCSKHFHVSCAWAKGCRFAFEVQPVRNKKRPPKDAVIIKFKDEEGVLQPCVWCTEHHFTHSERKTYDLGARDQASKLMYVRSNKVPKFAEAPLLLRQGRRLDPIVAPVLKPRVPTPPPPPPPAKQHILLSAIIEEEPAPQPTRATKKRRTVSMTPHVAAETPIQRVKESTPAPALLPAEDIAIEIGTPALEQPLPAKRERKPKPPRELPSPIKATKGKGGAPKRRKTQSFTPLEDILVDHNQLSYPPLPAHHHQSEYNLAHLPLLPDVGSLAGFPLDASQLPPIPNFTGGLPPLPALPPLDHSAYHFSPATSAPHLHNTVVFAAHVPTPALPPLPAAETTTAAPASEEVIPPAEPAGSTIDPALAALSAVAAAEAASRDAQQQQQQHAHASNGQREDIPVGDTNDREQQQHNPHDALSHPDVIAALEAAGAATAAPAPVRSGNGNGDVPDEEDPIPDEPGDEPADAAGDDPDYVEPSNAAAEEGAEAGLTPSGRPRRKTRAPIKPYDLPTPSGSRSRYGQVPARPYSPHGFDGTSNPMLNYVRAHESAQGIFRVDTPDDSDATSERGGGSPGPSSAMLPSPALFGNLPPLDGGDGSFAGGFDGSLPPLPSPSTTMRPARKRKSNAKQSSTPAVCSNCGTSDSPLFRRDAEGRQLCNSCGLYFKTHGHDRPQKVIARAIGAARVQKRKAQAEAGELPTPTTKRPKAAAMATAMAGSFVPVQPSPLQPMPAFSFGDPAAYAAGVAPVAGPSGSNHSEQGAGAGGSRASSSGAAGGLNGTLTSGLAAGYESPYGPGYASPAYPAPPAGTAVAEPAGAHAHVASSYPPPYAGAPAATPASYPAHAGYYGPRTGSGYYDPFSVAAPSASSAGPAGTNGAAAAGASGANAGAASEDVDSAELSRQALESLAAQALSFNVGQAVHGTRPTTPAAGTSEPGAATGEQTEQQQQQRASSAPTTAPAAPQDNAEPATTGAAMHPQTQAVIAHELELQRGGQPSPPPSAGAMPLSPLFKDAELARRQGGGSGASA
ncbi:hypothetical protein JCM3770_005947 [Rhodotorula araucariae]